MHPIHTIHAICWVYCRGSQASEQPARAGILDVCVGGVYYAVPLRFLQELSLAAVDSRLLSEVLHEVCQ